MLVISGGVSNLVFSSIQTFLSKMPYVYFIFKIAKKNLKERSFAYGNSELHIARIKDSHAPPSTPITLPLTAFPPEVAISLHSPVVTLSPQLT